MKNIFLASLFLLFSCISPAQQEDALEASLSGFPTCTGQSREKTCYKNGQPIIEFAPGCQISCPVEYSAKCEDANFNECYPISARCKCEKP